jgi:hypothetical protein
MSISSPNGCLQLPSKRWKMMIVVMASANGHVDTIQLTCFRVPLPRIPACPPTARTTPPSAPPSIKPASRTTLRPTVSIMAEAIATPRINSSYLDSFTNQTVRLTGKVVQLRGDQATVDSNGNVTAHLNRVRESHAWPNLVLERSSWPLQIAFNSSTHFLY